MIKPMSAVLPGGMPLAHADGAVVPRAIFTRVMMSVIATPPLPPQSPAQVLAATGRRDNTMRQPAARSTAATEEPDLLVAVVVFVGRRPDFIPLPRVDL